MRVSGRECDVSFALLADVVAAENEGMTIKGRVRDGVIVLEDGVTLPEGTAVKVSCDATPAAQPVGKKRIELPLVHSKHPGTLKLTGKRVSELAEEEDVSS